MAEHKLCYGTMFPEVIAPVESGAHSGKVFSFKIENFGLIRAERRVEAAPDAWEECRLCSDFDHCYKLSAGELMLQTAIRDV